MRLDEMLPKLIKNSERHVLIDDYDYQSIAEILKMNKKKHIKSLSSPNLSVPPRAPLIAWRTSWTTDSRSRISRGCRNAP